MSFDQAIEGLRWSWDHFRDDPLAQAICWRFPVVLDQVYTELAGGFSRVPIPRSLLIQSCERGIEAANLISDAGLRDSIQCALASRAGALHLEIGNSEQCARFLGLARSIAHNLSNEKLLGRVLSIEAEIYLMRGEVDAAKYTFIRSANLAKRSDDAAGKAIAIFGIGKACRILGDRLKAAHWLGQALQEAEALVLPELRGKVIQELGGLWMSLGEYEVATQCYTDAVSCATDSHARGQARLALGGALLASGAIEQARQVFEQAECDAKASGDRITHEGAIARSRELGNSYRRMH